MNDYKLYGMIRLDLENLTNLNTHAASHLGYPNPQNHRYLREMLSKAWTLAETRWRGAWIADLGSAI